MRLEICWEANWGFQLRINREKSLNVSLVPTRFMRLACLQANHCSGRSLSRRRTTTIWTKPDLSTHFQHLTIFETKRFSGEQASELKVVNQGQHWDSIATDKKAKDLSLVQPLRCAQWAATERDREKAKRSKCEHWIYSNLYRLDR